jgi:hypothetical protein
VLAAGSAESTESAKVNVTSTLKEVPLVETPAQQEHKRLGLARQAFAAVLKQKLVNAGYDIGVGSYGDRLALSGEVFKDTSVRVEVLATVRSMGLCPLGFRTIGIVAKTVNPAFLELMSSEGSQYSLGCSTE